MLYFGCHSKKLGRDNLTMPLAPKAFDFRNVNNAYLAFLLT